MISFATNAARKMGDSFDLLILVFLSCFYISHTSTHRFICEPGDLMIDHKPEKTPIPTPTRLCCLSSVFHHFYHVYCFYDSPHSPLVRLLFETTIKSAMLPIRHLTFSSYLKKNICFLDSVLLDIANCDASFFLKKSS